jgi:hypothetical protein
MEVNPNVYRLVQGNLPSVVRVKQQFVYRKSDVMCFCQLTFGTKVIQMKTGKIV